MLQRISSILTAPPTITDEDYKKMRKLVGSLKGTRHKYEEGLIQARNKKFFERIKTLPGIYNAREWEEQYKQQVSLTMITANVWFRLNLISCLRVVPHSYYHVFFSSSIISCGSKRNS